MNRQPMVYRLIEPLHISVALVYVLTFSLIERLISAALEPGFLLLDIPILKRWIRASTFSATLAGVLLTQGFACVLASTPPTTALAWRIGLAVPMLIGLSLLSVAHSRLTAQPWTIAQFERRHQTRSIERIFSKLLRNPLDAHFARLLIANSLVMLPAFACLLVIRPFSFACLFCFISVWLISGSDQETLDHTDIHNNVFRGAAHLSPTQGVLLRGMHLWLRLGLNAMHGRIPHFYRAQHVYIHHVENNDLGDPQSTLRYDRTSFFDFCRFALKLGLSFTFAADVFAYLAARSNRRQIRLLGYGIGGWFLMLVVIACFNPGAALALLLIRLSVGVPTAIDVNFWHGLADPDDPGNIARNTINILYQDEEVAGIGAMHAAHHYRSGEHWSRQCQLSHAAAGQMRDRGMLLFNNYLATKFTKMLLLCRFDVIALSTHPSNEEEIDYGRRIPEIRRRLAPWRPVHRSDTYRLLDRTLGAMYAYGLPIVPLPAIDPAAAPYLR
ncbi:hypothetical protein [Caballeronia sp. dw_276]|uniref:hypothetical protein n=1 Tax=Caballeronia sp. dw_276 TaxID=2719795 RepID=UPI001BD322AA|nr:hypothetical protein [Caballeronia sp. dw_276]